MKQAQAPLVLAAVAAITAAGASIAVAPDMRGLIGAVLAFTMIAIAVIDARRFIIPDELTGAALLIAAFQAWWLRGDADIGATLIEPVWRGVVMAALFYGIRVGYRAWRGLDGLGLGDVKLAAAAGALLNWTTLPVVVEMAALSALGAIAVMHFGLKRPLRRTTRLPFGLFLAPAIWAGWLIETIFGTLF